MRLLLIRHGMTEANERHSYCGSTDLSLSEKGRMDLEKLRAGRNRPEGDYECVTSGMKRTDETFEILFGREPDRRDAGFREIDFGRFECRTYEELKDDPDYQTWIMDTTGEQEPPQGESAGHFRKRVLNALSALECDTLLVAHGGVIAAIMAELFPEENRNLYQWQPSFGHGYKVELNDGNRSYTEY